MINTYDVLIRDKAVKHKLSLPLLRSQIVNESGGNPLQIGDGGQALGFMQVHRAAAKDVGGDWDALHAAVVSNDSDKAAELSLEMGAAYMARMLALFNGDETWALAAYNQGPTVVKKAYDYAMAVKGDLA